MSHHENWLEEKRSAYLYRILAETEAGAPTQRMFAELARKAEEQANVWAKGQVWSYAPDARARLVGALVRRLGARRMKAALAALKIRGLSALSGPRIARHDRPKDVSEVGQRHQIKGMGGNLRAAVFGINDGLVSNASLILGVAAASGASSGSVMTAGMAGLFAGALSMAAGEYVSVRSQRELLEYQLELERAELAEYPEEEAAELALIYEARGLAPEAARMISRGIIAHPERALHTLAREELGVDPDDLGSPWSAAISSFLAFALGGAIPLLPFLLRSQASHDDVALKLSVAFTATGLFATGASVSLFSGKSFVLSGLRMLLIGGGAGTVSYLLGSIVGGG